MSKEVILTILTLTLSGTCVGCSKLEQSATSNNNLTHTSKETPQVEQAEKRILKVAVFEGGYGSDYWEAVAKAFESHYSDVEVVIHASPEIGEMIRPDLLSGDSPDFIYLPSSNKSGITNTLIKDKLLADLTDIFEDPVLRERILPGFLENMATQPYDDGKIYLAPLYYSPTGLFYNKTVFKENNWEVPTTWEAFFTLGDEVREAGRMLFTYQGLIPGYLEIGRASCRERVSSPV